jgi:hypothetical protein
MAAISSTLTYLTRSEWNQVDSTDCKAFSTVPERASVVSKIAAAEFGFSPAFADQALNASVINGSVGRPVILFRPSAFAGELGTSLKALFGSSRSERTTTKLTNPPAEIPKDFARAAKAL